MAFGEDFTIHHPPSAIHAFLPAVASAILALALYAVTLGGTYVYDDRYIIETDPRIADLSRWGELWTKDYFNGGVDNLYRPLVSMTYAAQVWLHGRSEGSAWAFHLVNWLMHAGVCALVAELALRLTSRTRVALMAGLLFAAHPIHVEAVAGVVGRAELMCALGVVGAMVLMLHRPLSMGRVVAIWACLVLALLSKEQGMLLPAMLAAVLPLRPGPRDPAERPRLLWLLILVCWTMAAYVYLRENVLGLKFWWPREFLDWTINPVIRSSGADRALMPFALLGRYTQLLIAPWRLSLDYGFDVMNSNVRASDPFFVAGIATAVAWTVATIISMARRSWTVLVCLGGFALFFGLVANAMTIIGTNLSERLMYIPSVFFCVLASLALARLRGRAMTVFVALILAAASVRTVTYAARWNDRIALYRQNLAEEPRSVRLHMLLAYELQEAGQLNEADEVLGRARTAFADYWRVWESSGVLALKMNDLDLARVYYDRGARLWPAMARSSLARDLASRVAATRTATAPAKQPFAQPSTRPTTPPQR